MTGPKEPETGQCHSPRSAAGLPLTRSGRDSARNRDYSFITGDATGEIPAEINGTWSMNFTVIPRGGNLKQAGAHDATGPGAPDYPTRPIRRTYFV